jgi:FkbM family methyltransferase
VTTTVARRVSQSDWWPVILVSAVVGLVAFTVGSRLGSNRLEHVIDRYEVELRVIADQFAGQPRSSQFLEEWIIRDFFRDRREGFFLDVGAHHYRDFSNTFYLETVLGWSGLAVEPQTIFAGDYARHRPRTRFVAMFATDTDDGRIPLYVPPAHPGVASSTPEFAAAWGATQSIEVPTTTLNRALEAAGVARLDFLSMDIELHEPKALAGFDIARYRPTLVCVEAHAEVRQSILDYFQRHGYVLVGKYLRTDFNNLYFTPATP